MTPYRTAAGYGEAEYEDKRSRFIGRVQPVASAAEARAFIDEMRRKYADATHNVFAYVLREGNILRWSDDGEPGGTSGQPTLAVLQGAGLTDVCCVTPRYFGGALLGAPLTHDFAVISLSNRLTPWEKIEKRLACAAEADLGIVLYNPRSKGRPDNLRMACDILLRYLPEDRPCGVAHSIGREGEAGEYMTLGALRDADVDMFSTVFIGNAMTKMIGGAMVTPRGYRRKEVPDA